MSNSTSSTITSRAGGLLFIHAQTALHPGSGTALGVVDLPIQRERHTQWPVIPGSAIKGILRDACRERAIGKYKDDGEDIAKDKRRTRRRKANEDDPDLVAAFGPGKVDESSSHAGAVSLTDARILAFPVRSLRGVFAWVTCKAVLERLNRDLKLAGQSPLGLKFDLGREQALCAENSPLLVDGDKLVLEEFEFVQKEKSTLVADWIASNAVSDEFTQERVKSHFVILHDDDFTHFVRHATEIVARIGLNYESKTVQTGALFYQECVPAETIFYTVALASRSRRDGDHRGAADILKYVRDNMPPVLQIGGDETTGKGLCGVRLVEGKAGGQ